MLTSPVRIQARHLFLAAGLSFLFLFFVSALVQAEELGPPPSGGTILPPPGGIMPQPQQVEAKVFINDPHQPPPPPGGMVQPNKPFMPPEGSGMFKPGDPTMGDPGMMGKDTTHTKVFIDNKNQPGQFGSKQGQPGMMGQKQFGGQQSQQGGMMGQNGMMGGERSEEQMDKEREMREQQDLRRMQQGLKGMEQGMKMYRSQLVKLQKQGVAVPASVSETLGKITAILAAIKSAKTFDEAREAGMEELQDLMMELDENRQVLEKLSRWSQTIKQVDRSITNLRSQLVRDKKLVTKLSKQGFDIADLVVRFEQGVNELKATRDEASALIKTDPEAAFNLLEEGFFEKMEDVMKSEHIIQGLANYGQFASQFKKRMADADKMIKNLKRKQIDTSALESDLTVIREKGNELKAAIQNKEFDEETLPELFEGLQDAWMEFESDMDDLTGGDDRPWEQGGGEQFRSVTSQFSKFIPAGNEQM